MELRDVQFVIEATSEKMEIKKEVFRELAMEAGPKTIVATNTSALPVSELAEVTVSPEHVIGLHFFNPVSRMKLVEVVIAKQTSEETRDRSLAFVRQIGKLPVVVRDSPGFLVNRVLFRTCSMLPSYLRAAWTRSDRSRVGGMGDADGSVAIDR
jgi:3-hydroxyacyl-CoA dehydrogenase